MNTRIFKLLSAMLLLLSLSLGIMSCSKEPDEPTNEIINKDHGDPMKAELLLVEGHLHGKYGFHQNKEVEGVKYLKKIQKITYSLTTDKGWGINDESAKQFNVKSAIEGDEGWVVYGLWINYYNANGELMTQDFVENGQDLIHQHFFIPQNIKPTFDGKVEEGDDDKTSLFHYEYCDTNPWNKNMHSEGATLTGDKNPIGLKGYFKFNKTRKQFDLNIELMHAANSKFDNTVAKASPFHTPSNAQRQRDHWDVKIKVPVVIFANQKEYSDADINTPENEISDSDMSYLNSIANTYGITWREALQDIDALINGDTSHTEGDYWF